MFRTLAATAVLAFAAVSAAPAAAQGAAPNYPGQAEFRDLYKQLIEINTTASAGSCTDAARAMGARLKAAGYADADMQLLVPADRPRDGNLIAVLRGTDAKAKPMMLLAHIDVVEARRADWERDPFKLVEENGYFYARGASDDKAMAASFTDAMVRYKKEGFKPRRSIKLALTCGEETPDTFNGVSWLLANHRDALDAVFALNEGARGQLEGDRRVYLGIQAGEKVYQDFTLETTNPGGHSSRPLKDNAIYRLSAGLSKLGAYDFPARINEATHLHFERMSAIIGGQ
ncbi:MAG: peptidase, partial [Phenylobacterium sp.]|nr:peptidase [Phenylobacterium sp.]